MLGFGMSMLAVVVVGTVVPVAAVEVVVWPVGVEGLLFAVPEHNVSSRQFQIPTICRYIVLTFVVWISLTVYASMPLHVVYSSVPLREQTCHDFGGESVNYIHLSCQ